MPVAVEVHESKSGGELWYRVGRVDTLALTLVWSEGRRYGRGHEPAVAAQGPRVVEVHRGLKKKNWQGKEKAPRLYYRLGSLDESTRTLVWGESQRYAKGRFPAVALSGTTAVEVHQASRDSVLWYSVGKLDTSAGRIAWARAAQYDLGFFPALDVEGNLAVEVHRALEKKDRLGRWKPLRLFGRTGALFPGAYVVNWGESRRYDKGRFPAVALSGTTAVEVHQSLHEDYDLWYHTGIFAAGRALVWGESRKYARGRMPAVDLQGRTVVEVHQSPGDSRLWCRAGRLRPQTGTIEWGRSYPYDRGSSPGIALRAAGMPEN